MKTRIALQSIVDQHLSRDGKPHHLILREEDLTPSGDRSNYKLYIDRTKLAVLNKFSTFANKMMEIYDHITDKEAFVDSYYDLAYQCWGHAYDIMMSTHRVRQTLYGREWGYYTDISTMTAAKKLMDQNYKLIKKYAENNIKKIMPVATYMVDPHIVLSGLYQTLIQNYSMMMLSCATSLADPYVVYDSMCRTQEDTDLDFMAEAFLG